MRIGVVVLPQQRWGEASARWKALDDMGFDHAWTYDHLAWRTLADEPWFATVPTLTAAAVVTSRIRLGTWVASPNYRHPVTFAKELMTLDDVSGGRFELGVGAGGIGFDAGVLGGDVLPPRERVDRLAEFTGLLDRLLTNGTTTWAGERYEAVGARMLPGCVQRPRLPFVVAANGPRAMAVAAHFGQGWATPGAEDAEAGQWWEGVEVLARRMDGVLAEAGRDPASLRRYLSADSPGMALTSRDHFADVVGRARDLGFTDVVTHWPRAQGVWAGDERVLEQVAADLDGLRAD